MKNYLKIFLCIIVSFIILIGCDDDQNANLIDVNVDYNEQMGTVTIDGEKIKQKSYYYLSLARIKATANDGYEFVGFVNNDTNTFITNKQEYVYSVKEELNLLANFKEEGSEETQYSITYILDGGINNHQNPSSFKIGDGIITLKDATKEGYLFKGWYLDQEYNELVSIISTDIKNDLTLYACFEEVQEITEEVVLELEDTILKWNEVSNATLYKVYKDDVLLDQTTQNEINLGTYIILSGEYNITVIACNSISSSDEASIQYVVDKYDYSGSYYNSINLSNKGTTLKESLRTLITTTHTKRTSYDDVRKYTKKTDADPNKSGNIILFYSLLSIKGDWDSARTWNREHVWPQSKGWFKTSQAGSDLHHIRPTDPTANSIRGNYPYGEVNGGVLVKCGSTNNYASTYCYLGGYFEPRDEIKGDVARIIFYLLTRYSESDNFSITSVAQSMDILLKWNTLDPIDDMEIRRNEAVYEIQGNRNPFIDHSYLANSIWG